MDKLDNSTPINVEVGIKTDTTTGKSVVDDAKQPKVRDLFLNPKDKNIPNKDGKIPKKDLLRNTGQMQHAEENDLINEDAQNNRGIHKSKNTTADFIFFIFYPIRVKVIDAGLTFRNSTSIVKTLKITTVSLAVITIVIAAILSVPELFIAVPVIFILAYIFWPAAEPQEEEYKNTITPPKLTKESLEEEVNKMLAIADQEEDRFNATVAANISKQKELIDIRRKNRKNKIEAVAKFLVEQEKKQENVNKQYKEALATQEVKLQERIKKREDNSKSKKKEELEVSLPKKEEEYTIVIHPPKEEEKGKLIQDEVEDKTGIENQEIPTKVINDSDFEETEETEETEADINPEIQVESTPKEEKLEVVDQELQDVLQDIDINQLNTMLAKHINESIREMATKAIKERFKDVDFSSVTIAQNIKVTQVKSPAQAYQYMMYNLNQTIDNANGHINQKTGKTTLAKVVNFTDLQIQNKFDNNKLDYSDINISNIARTAATQVVYFLYYNNTIPTLADKFQNNSSFTVVLKNLQTGIAARSLPYQGIELILEKSDGTTESTKTTEYQDVVVTNKVLDQLGKFTGTRLQIGDKKLLQQVRKKTHLKKGQKPLNAEMPTPVK